MGKISEWASQGSGQPNETYQLGVFYPYAAILSNPATASGGTVDYTESQNWFGAADTTFNVADIVYANSSRVAGSPFESIRAYNPDSLISDISDALDLMQDAIDDFTQETLDDAVTTAVTQADTIMGDTALADLVASYRERAESNFQRDVSSVYAGLWESGAIVGSQTFIAAALLRNESTRQVMEYERGLTVSRENTRAQMISQLISTAIQIAAQKMQARQSYAGSRMDYLKFVVTTKQDQMDKDLDYLTRDATWDLDLIQYAQNALGAIYGAQTVPRTQTKGERFLANVNSSISTGIQGGLALGNPGAGVALGAFNFISNALLNP